jgi:o-succinylbenzoate synthase
VKFSVTPYELPLVVPFTTANATVARRRGLLVALADGKHIGHGEVAPLPGWTPIDADQASTILRGAIAAVEAGRDLDDVLDELEASPEVRAGLSGAAADLAARRQGLPLARFLDPDSSETVAVNAVVGSGSPQQAADAGLDAIQRGFSVIKMKVGVAAPEVDIERVATMRSTVGALVELRLDANGAWDASTARRVLGSVAVFGIAFCEEPVAGIDAIAELGAESPIPLAIDESARTVDDVARALGTGAIDVVVIKPQSMGGPDLAMRAVRLTREFGATPVVTTMIDSAIGVRHALHVAAASGATLAHGLATSAMFTEDLADPPRIVDGTITIGSLPGLGVTPG